MVFAEFLEVLRRIRERAQKHRAALEKSEALTRYTLIDPVLRALGWNTEDPDCVQPEFITNTGTLDYALFWQGKLHIVVEAKALGKRLEGAQDKAFQYAYQNGVPYFVTTDGMRWELYDVFERDKDKRRLFVINIEEGEGQAARYLLALWRPALPEAAVPPKHICPPPQGKGELTVEELLAKLKRGEIPLGSKPPKQIHFPDGKSCSTKYWRDLLTTTVEWLIERRSLPVPIRLTRTGKMLVAKTAEGMRAPKEVRGYYVETHASAESILRYLQVVLTEAGMDPKDFRLTLGS